MIYEFKIQQWWWFNLYQFKIQQWTNLKLKNDNADKVKEETDVNIESVFSFLIIIIFFFKI